MSLVLDLYPYHSILCFASHWLVDESKDERTYARGRSRIEMKRQLIKFCEEDGRENVTSKLWGIWDKFNGSA